MDISLDGFDDLYGSDPALERDGAWMPVPGKDGWRIKLRSQTAPVVRDAANRLAKKHVPLFQAGRSPSSDMIDKDAVELFATAVVVDWQGFGFPCTPDNVRAVLTKYPAFLAICRGWSDNRDNYRSAQTEAQAGNSEVSSEHA